MVYIDCNHGKCWKPNQDNLADPFYQIQLNSLSWGLHSLRYFHLPVPIQRPVTLINYHWIHLQIRIIFTFDDSIIIKEIKNQID